MFHRDIPLQPLRLGVEEGNGRIVIGWRQPRGDEGLSCSRMTKRAIATQADMRAVFGVPPRGTTTPESAMERRYQREEEKQWIQAWGLPGGHREAADKRGAKEDRQGHRAWVLSAVVRTCHDRTLPEGEVGMDRQRHVLVLQGKEANERSSL